MGQRTVRWVQASWCVSVVTHQSASKAGSGWPSVTKFEFLVIGRLVVFRAWGGPGISKQSHCSLSVGRPRIIMWWSQGSKERKERPSPTANTLSKLLPESHLLLSIGQRKQPANLRWRGGRDPAPWSKGQAHGGRGGEGEAMAVWEDTHDL